MPASPPCDTCGMAPRKPPTFLAYQKDPTPACLHGLTVLAERAVSLSQRGKLTSASLAPHVDEYLAWCAKLYQRETGRKPTGADVAGARSYLRAEVLKQARAYAPRTRPNHHGGYHAPGDPLGNYQRKAVLRGSGGKDRVVTFQRAMRQPGGIIMLDPGGKGPAMARTMMFVRESAIKSIEGPIENL